MVPVDRSHGSLSWRRRISRGPVTLCEGVVRIRGQQDVVVCAAEFFIGGIKNAHRTEGVVQGGHQLEELVGSLSTQVCHYVLDIDPPWPQAIFDQGEEALGGEALRYGASLEYIIDDGIVGIR